MSKASLELGGGNWAAKDNGDGTGNLLGYAVGDTSGKYLPREFTFSRGADIGATRVNKDGLIEKYRENLFVQSNQFDTTWTVPGATATSGQTGYDGTSDAWLLEASSVSTSYATQSVSVSGVQTHSVYAKAGTADYLVFYNTGGASIPRAWFNLSTGNVETKSFEIQASMESVGSGWYRCSLTYDYNITAVRMYVGETDGSFTTAVGKNIYIQDAQLERGLVATDYLESDDETGKAGVLDNLPRIDYTSGSAQLLMEPSRTNLVSISEGIPEATGAVTRTLNYGVAPDGTTSSLKVQKNGGSENDRIIIADDLAVLNASTYTVSGFVKNIDIVDTGVTTIAARVDAGTLFRQGYEWTGSSLATTSYSSNGSTSNTILEDYGNGWWRIGFTFTTDGTQLDFEIDIDRRNGSDTTSIETWGWQLEAFQVYDESDVLISAKGGFVTSYIPTYGTPTTRNADGIPAAGAGVQDLSSFFKGDDFTLVIDFADNSSLVRDGTDGGIRLSNGDSQSGAFRIYRNASTETRLRILFDPISGSDIAVEINSDTPKVAIRKVRSTGTFTIYIDGVPATGGALTDGSFSDAVNYDITSDDFKIWGVGSTIKINSIKLFDEALSDNELASLTS